jgi:hypothetical protein
VGVARTVKGNAAVHGIGDRGSAGLADVNDSGNDNVNSGARLADGGTWNSLFWQRAVRWPCYRFAAWD